MSRQVAKLDEDRLRKNHKFLTISERIFKIRNHFSLTKDGLGEIAGVSGTSVANIESGQTKNPGVEILGAISSKLPINPSWLLTGQGEMLLSDAPAQRISPYISPPDISNASRIPVDKLNLRVLPYLPIEARAGLAEFYADDLSKYPWESADTLAVLDVPDTSEYKEAIVVAINGDSMEPTIKNGSKVVVTPVQRGNWQYINSGVYCVIYNNNFVVKRVKDNTLLETGLLRLYSDNPSGGSFPVKGEDIRAVWRVRWAAYTPID